MTKTDIDKKEYIIIFIQKKMSEKKITRYRLAKMTGIRESTLQQVFKENYGSQLRLIKKICDALEIEIIFK